MHYVTTVLVSVMRLNGDGLVVGDLMIFGWHPLPVDLVSSVSHLFNFGPPLGQSSHNVAMGCSRHSRLGVLHVFFQIYYSAKYMVSVYAATRKGQMRRKRRTLEAWDSFLLSFKKRVEFTSARATSVLAGIDSCSLIKLVPTSLSFKWSSRYI